MWGRGRCCWWWYPEKNGAVAGGGGAGTRCMQGAISDELHLLCCASRGDLSAQRK